jgi:hypothetical protein
MSFAKKILVVSVVVLGFGVQASQACMPQVGEKHVSLSCHDVAQVMDAGLMVDLEETYMGPGQENGLVLDIAEQSIMGPQPVGRFDVKKELSDLIGSPVRYVGVDVVLSVNFTSAPHRDGHFATLTRMVDDREITSELLCKTIVRPTYRCF